MRPLNIFQLRSSGLWTLAHTVIGLSGNGIFAASTTLVKVLFKLFLPFIAEDTTISLTSDTEVIESDSAACLGISETRVNVE